MKIQINTTSRGNYENYNCIPDVIITGKGLGGGMPIGAFIASSEYMSTLKEAPKLGHITTFGGHPVIAAAAHSTLTSLYKEDLMTQIAHKEKIVREKLVHPLIQEIRGKGLMLALILPSAELASKLILKSMDRGLLLFWLLFEPKAARITPPLNISDSELEKGCEIILSVLNELE